MAKIVLATCQFHIEKKPEKNLRAITRQMMDAKAKGAHLVHFSEACLMLVSFHNAGMTLKQYDHYTMSVPATL